MTGEFYEPLNYPYWSPYKWWSSPGSDLKVYSVFAEIGSYVHLGILKHAGADWTEIMGSDFEIIIVRLSDFTLTMQMQNLCFF